MTDAGTGQAEACVAATVSAFGRVDSLVNVAGPTDRGTLVDTTPDLFDAHIAVNLKAPFFLMQAVVADLVARNAPGTIVNIISASEHAASQCPSPCPVTDALAPTWVAGAADMSLREHRPVQVAEVREAIA